MPVIKNLLKALLFKFLSLLIFVKIFLNKKNNKKIFIIGDIYSVSGLGSTVRALIKSLEGRFEFYLINLPLSNQSEQKFSELRKYEVPYLDSGINIFIGSPTLLARALLRRDFLYVISNYSIGIWFWELPSMPKEWFGVNKLIDEVWVQSEFTQKVFGFKNKKVKLMPFALSRKINKFYDRSYFSIPKNAFVFTTAFDYLSRIERKNPFSTIFAFKEEFGNDPNVMLIIKTINKFKDINMFFSLQSMIEGSSNITLIDGCYSDDETLCLIANSDCFISLHRAEGLGLAMAEAMSLGTLVIATGYSGNTTYMNHTNSLLVQYDLVPVKKGHYSNHKNNFWAEPCITDARKKMRYAFQRAEDVQCMVSQASKDIEKYSIYSQGEWVANQMNELFNVNGYESTRL